MKLLTKNKALFIGGLFFLFNHITFAGVDRLKTEKMPKITLTKSDSILIDEYLKKNKDQTEAVIIQMVCLKKRKQYKCDPIKMNSPKK